MKYTKYTINYHTGAGDEEIETDDLKLLQNLADEGASYTQRSITIECTAEDDDEDVTIICMRPWIGCTSGIEDQDDPIDFGNFGYYADWQSPW
jgi:hypothetical protein